MSFPRVYLGLAPAQATEVRLEESLALLDGIADVERWPGPGNPTPEALAEAVARSTVLITGWGTPRISALETWDAQDSPLRMVVHSAGSVKHLVPFAALERGLLVCHANDALADAVAEFTVGALILGRRRVFEADRQMREGRWRMTSSFQHELRGTTVGIIGASAIGRRVMRMLVPFGVNLLLADPYCPPALAGEYGATLVGLHELLEQSDTVSLHAPVTPETLGMLGAHEFARMKDGALFLNTARGRLIDASALLAELRTGRISAILDVTDPTEPLPADSPFFGLENCTILPHMAGISSQARQRQGQIVIDEVLRFLRGERQHHAVSASQWQTMA